MGAGPAGLALTAAGDSAYKELCAMANDIGQPEAVYRFLALSSHHAKWHARGGSGLAFEALLRSNARKEVKAPRRCARTRTRVRTRALALPAAHPLHLMWV